MCVVAWCAGAAVGPFLAGLLAWNDTFYLLMGSVFVSALVSTSATCARVTHHSV